MIDGDPNKPLLHWASLPGRPDQITVHAAPTAQDVRDALREAERRKPQWIILDTEGSVRGAMAFKSLRLDLVLTPLAASQIEAIQAIKAAEMIGQASGRVASHRCLVTRLPAAVNPASLKLIVDVLRARRIELLPTPLFESEAFRMLFSVGGGFDALESAGVAGVPAARANVGAYMRSVFDLLPPQAS